MKYNNVQEIENIGNVLSILETNEVYEKTHNYQVYVGFCDSLYGNICTAVDEDEQTALIGSEETYGDGSSTTVNDLLSMLTDYPNVYELTAEPAEDIDPLLDLQLEEPSKINKIAIDDICQMVVLIAE